MALFWFVKQFHWFKPSFPNTLRPLWQIILWIIFFSMSIKLRDYPYKYDLALGIHVFPRQSTGKCSEQRKITLELSRFCLQWIVASTQLCHMAALHSGTWCPLFAFLTCSALDFSLIWHQKKWVWEGKKKKKVRKKALALLLWGANSETWPLSLMFEIRIFYSS